MSYHFCIESTGEEYYELEGYTQIDVENALSSDFSDLFAELCGDVSAHNLVKGDLFCLGDIDEVYDIIHSRFKDEVVKVYCDDTIVASYPLAILYEDLADNYIGSENGDIHTCGIWTSQLQNFIDKAEWMVALYSNKHGIIDDIKNWPVPIKNSDNTCWFLDSYELTPIMWFGIKGEDNLKIWTLSNDCLPAMVPEEDGMGSYGGQMRIDGFELNYLELYDKYGNSDWYFGACGNEGANFKKVIEECPIDLLSIYKEENGYELIKQYCLNLQGC